jgi:RecA/RadA recombinase
MAPKKKTEAKAENPQTIKAPKLPDFSWMQKVKTGNEIADDPKIQEKLKKIPYWVDSGSYSLNAGISGSIYGGYPGGRVTMLAGKEACGKSLLAQYGFCKSMNEMGYFVGYVDTEGAQTIEDIEAAGAAKGGVKLIEQSTVEGVRKEIKTFINNFTEAAEKHGSEARLGIVLDSQGMMTSDKEQSVIDKDKRNKDGVLTKDMTQAQVIKSLYKTILVPILVNEATMIVTNHTYQEQGMFPKTVVSGGSGGKYGCSVIALLGMQPQTAADGHVIGNILSMKLEKGRFSRKGLVVRAWLDFEKGLNRYYGLHDFAYNAGLIEQIITKNKDAIAEQGVDMSQIDGRVTQTDFLDMSDYKSVAKFNDCWWVIKDPKKEPKDWIIKRGRAIHSKKAIGTILDEIEAYCQEHVKIKGLNQFGDEFDDDVNDTIFDEVVEGEEESED